MDDGPTSGNGRNDTARVETFSDGVFAIAITLLVLDLVVPHTEASGDLIRALIAQWPSYLGYVLSFFVLGTMWANHHNRFRYIERSDHILLFLNVLLMMFVVLNPFTTALLSEYLLGSNAERRIAVVVYSGVMALTAVVYTGLWMYASVGYRLVDRSLHPAQLWALTKRYLAGVALYWLAFALAFFSTIASLVIIAGLAALFVLPEPSIRDQESGRESSNT